MGRPSYDAEKPLNVILLLTSLSGFCGLPIYVGYEIILQILYNFQIQAYMLP